MHALKIVLAATISICILILASSCNESNMLSSNYAGDWFNSYYGYLQSENIQLGMLHNQILENFNSEHNLLKDGKLHVQEFVSLFKRAANDAFRMQDSRLRVEEKDIVEVLRVFASLKEKGVANVFRPANSIPHELLDYLFSKKLISHNERIKYMNAFRSIEYHSNLNIKFDPNKLMSCLATNIDSSKDKIFFDITDSSIEFWTNIYENSISDSTFPPQDDKFNEKVNYCVLLWWDMSGSLVGGMIGGFVGATIGTALASIAYVIWGEEEIEELLDKYSY